ncbi:MAG: hypothetical protein HY826_13255 [Actinobacteria bacterium]|nr:hypothetical protein [Actinomycetota bacterium]
MKRTIEAVVTAAVAATMAWLLGGLLHPMVGVAMATAAGLNGAISGWRQIYAWRSLQGWIAFVLDSTWATLSVAVGLLTHVAGRLKGPLGYEVNLSHRQNRHVYRDGFSLQPGFALTVGNVISGAGDVDVPRRRRLITDHEAVHVWQARWFGPLYLPLYGLWSLAGIIGGVVVWLRGGRKEKLGKAVESCSYYLNPYEWWAYSRDDLWPPPGKLKGVGWSKPAVRPLADVRADRAKKFAEPIVNDAVNR